MPLRKGLDIKNIYTYQFYPKKSVKEDTADLNRPMQHHSYCYQNTIKGLLYSANVT